MLKRTPLYEEHIRLSARMVEFAGYEMPVQYTGVVEEHLACRGSAALFDISHMGEFSFTGPQALSYLESITANEVSRLTDGQAQYSLLLNPMGCVIDDIIVYRLHASHFLMVVNASNIEKDWAWVNAHKRVNVVCHNDSHETALIAIQGPKAKEILQPFVESNLDNLKSFHFLVCNWAGGKKYWVSQTGYTGEDGFEIFCDSNEAAPLWQKLLEVGSPLGLTPAGLGARDTLRLEMRYSLYGHEITEETGALEAGLGWVVKLEKGDFIGKNALLKIKEEGLKRKLVGFKLLDKGVPRQGYAIMNHGKEIGFVTSGTHSPSLGQPIGLGYVPVAYTSLGTKFFIDIRKTPRLAEVVETPFYKRG